MGAAVVDGTIDFREVVYVHFTLDDRSDPDGLVGKFLQFQLDNEVFGPRGGSCGNGHFSGSFDIEHKDAIEAWLTEHGLWPPA